MAKVVMVSSGKGGTGKSTFSSYFAYELALQGYKVLLTELDVGLRSIDVISGVMLKTVYDIGDVLFNRCTAEKALIKSPYTNNLDIISAPYQKTDIPLDNMKKFVGEISSSYDFLILDTAAGMGEAYQAALSVANQVVIVATSDRISVRDAKLVSDDAYKNGKRDIRLVINKFSRNIFSKSNFEDLDEIIDEVSAQLLGVIPNSEEIIINSVNGTMLQDNLLEKNIYKAIAQRFTGRYVKLYIQ